MDSIGDKRLLRDFLEYLEKDGKSSGYILVDKGSWDNTSLFFRKIPPKGETTRVKIDFQITRPDQDEIDAQIELFLKKRK